MTTMTTQPSTAPIFKDRQGQEISDEGIAAALQYFAFDIRTGLTPPDKSFCDYVEQEYKWQFCGTEAER